MRRMADEERRIGCHAAQLEKALVRRQGRLHSVLLLGSRGKASRLTRKPYMCMAVRQHCLDGMRI